MTSIAHTLQRQKATLPICRAHKAIRPMDAMKLDEAGGHRQIRRIGDVAVNLASMPRNRTRPVPRLGGAAAGTGKKVAVAVFAQGDKARGAAKGCRRRYVGMEDLAEQIKAQDDFRRGLSPAPTPCASSASLARYWVRAADA